MTHQGTTRMETARLLLRPFVLEDAEAMYANWCSDPEVTRYLMWPTHTDVSVTKAVLADWVPRYENPSHYHWAIAFRDAPDNPFGNIAVVRQDEAVDMVHIGYCIGKKHWNQGVVTEAFSALIPFLFEEVGANRIESRHDPRNPGSGRVMQKCGLVYEGTLRQSDHNNQGFCDAAYYALLAEDWRAGQQV